MNDHDALLRLTFDLAREAREKGNHPFGALLALDNQVLLTAQNSVVSEQDPTRHAELVLISEAARQFSPEVLQQATLYASTEPCAMCATAIYWSGVSNVVYGCPAEVVAVMARERFAIPCREIFAHGDRSITVTGPLLLAEATAVPAGYWS